jgi:hypothetical protein
MAKGFDLGDASSLASTGLVLVVGGALVYMAYKSNLLGLAAGAVEGAAGLVVDGVGHASDAYKQNAAGSTGTGQAWWERLLSNPISDSWNEIYNPGIKATSGYVVIRKRDFNSQWIYSNAAYAAAVDMYPGNRDILSKYVLDSGMKLKKSLQNIVKLTDFVVIRPNGEIQSA